LKNILVLAKYLILPIDYKYDFSKTIVKPSLRRETQLCVFQWPKSERKSEKQRRLTAKIPHSFFLINRPLVFPTGHPALLRQKLSSSTSTIIISIPTLESYYFIRIHFPPVYLAFSVFKYFLFLLLVTQIRTLNTGYVVMLQFDDTSLCINPIATRNIGCFMDSLTLPARSAFL
jgi:hypothetical protein